MAISTTGQCDILPVSGLSGPKITPSTDDSPPLLPYLHYMSERDRVHRYSATKRTTMLASLPGRCPYRARSSLKNSNKLELGWLEFHSPDPPDPEVARPGDVWIQVPLDFDPPTTTTADPSLCRLFVCYSQEGRLWTEWEGDERIHSNDPPVGMHPFASPALWGGTTKRDEQFYLAFTGSEFTWVTGTRLAGITTQWRHGKFSGLWMRRLATKHTEGAIPFLTPAEAIAAWAERKTLTASGVQRKGERKRVSTEPTHDLPSAKRPRPTTDFSAETSSLPVSQGWHPMSAPLPSSLESRNAPYHYRFIPWPHLSYWAVVPPIPAPSSTPPSSDASNGPVGITNAPPSPTFVLRPATFACSSPPVDETQPSGEPSHPHSRPPPPPPPSPSPPPLLQPKSSAAESSLPPEKYPLIRFTPTLSPRSRSKSDRKLDPSSSTPITDFAFQVPFSPTSASISTSAPPSTMIASTSTPSNSLSAPPHAQGRRAPEGTVDSPPGVRGKYAKAGATQRGWSLYIGETELLMPIPCDKCKRAGALCSGMEGERCGRCRAIRKPCSHSTPLHPHQRQPPSSLSVAKSFQSRSRKKADTAAAPKLKPVVEKKVLVPPSSAQEETGGVANKRSSPESKGGGKLVFKSQVELTAGTPAKSVVTFPSPPTPSVTQDVTPPPLESLDEDDNAVEELMDLKVGESEGVDIGDPIQGVADDDESVELEPAVAFLTTATTTTTTSSSQDKAPPDHAFILRDDEEVHVNASARNGADATGAADVDISVLAPSSTSVESESRGYQDGDDDDPKNQCLRSQVVENQEERVAATTTTIVCAESVSSAPPADTHGLALSTPMPISMSMLPSPSPSPSPSQVTPNAEGLSSLDPTCNNDYASGDPAPNCSQEVGVPYVVATDCAAARGGSSRPIPHQDLPTMRTMTSWDEITLPYLEASPTRDTFSKLDKGKEKEKVTPLHDNDDSDSKQQELVYFMELTLDGVAQVEEGLRGIFAVQKRKRARQKKKKKMTVLEGKGKRRGR